MVVDWCKRSIDHDVTMTSLVSSRASATHSSPSLFLSSPSFSPSFPSLPFSISSLSSLCPSSSSPSLDPSKSAISYSVAVHVWPARFASQASRQDLTVVNMVQMWVENMPGFSWHHVSSIPWSFVLCSSMLVFATMVAFMAQLIMVCCVCLSSSSRCWPDWP